MENNRTTQILSGCSRALLVVLLIVLTAGCQRNNEADTKSLSAYLNKVHSKGLEEALYIIVPVNSCDGCRQIVYRNLLTTSHSKDIKIVFSGKVREALTNQYLGRLNIMGVELLYDPDEKATGYGLLEEEYPMQFISFIDVMEADVVSKEILKPNMINGDVDIRKEMFKNYIN